jgi:2-dehydropantoate 2-reductase
MKRRRAAAGGVVEHRMSVLQDLEHGRSLKIAALVTAVQEHGVATRTVDTMLILAQERARQPGVLCAGRRSGVSGL